MILNTAIHKNILIKILKDVYSDATVGPILGFKGGTAALLFYGLNRFSVDLDFDLLDTEKEDYVFDQIKKILETYGTLKEKDKKRFNLFFLLSYAEKIKGARNIKVEINRRNFGSRYEVKSYLGIPMKVMIREDMFAHKIVAMYERIGTTNRDIFDACFFLQNNWDINREIVEKRTKMSFREFLRKCVELLEEMDNRNILAGMGELLDEKQKAWAKTKLKDEVIFQLKLRLDNEK